MRRQLLLASVGAVALAGTAVAADLAPPPPPPPPVPVYSWTGLYVGAQVGYAWGNDNISALGVGAFGGPASLIVTSNFGTSPKGVIGGGHIGYNVQINQWLVGLEGTADGANFSASSFGPFLGGPATGIAETTRADVQGSIRARAGIAIDRFLVYATGGVAFTGLHNHYTDTTGFFTGVPGFSDASISKTRAGWTVGAGLEYAITNNWSVRVEYRYEDFGHYTDFPFVALLQTAPPVLFGGNSLAVQHHVTENQVQAGISYKLNSMPLASVVAKY